MNKRLLPGQTYEFMGLDGLGEQPKPNPNARRVVEVISISVTGNVCIRINTPDEKSGINLFLVLLPVAERLVELGIWKPIIPTSTRGPIRDVPSENPKEVL